MLIIPIEKDKLTCEHPFVSRAWGEIKGKNHWESYAFYIKDDKNREYEVLALKRVLYKIFPIIYLPFSPFPLNGGQLLSDPQILEKICKTIGSQLKGFVVRVDLPFSYGKNQLIFKIDKPFHLNKESIQPVLTSYIDLNLGYENIKSTYRKRALRNIKKNERIVKLVKWQGDDSSLKQWYEIYKKVAVEDGFISRPLSYIENIMSKKFSTLYLALIDGRIEGGVIILFGKDVSVYLLGASNKNIKYSVSYSLQDFAIKESCRKACSFYDFYGVGDEKSHLKTLTLFKSAFGGNIIQRCETIDYPISKTRYFLFHIFDIIRLYVFRKVI